MHDAYFRYKITLPVESNPPGTMDRFSEDLRAWFVARGLGYSMGALGGSLNCYGAVGHRVPATEADRQAMAEWLRSQRIHATVRLGAVEHQHPPDLLTPITDWVFEVDNLTDADRADAAAYDAEIRRKIEALHAKRANRGA